MPSHLSYPEILEKYYETLKEQEQAQIVLRKTENNSNIDATSLDVSRTWYPPLQCSLSLVISVIGVSFSCISLYYDFFISFFKYYL